MLKFINEDVAIKYTSKFVGDPVVHLPGKKATGFKVKLSTITLVQADKLFESPSQNLLQLASSISSIPEEKKGKAEKNKDKETLV